MSFIISSALSANVTYNPFTFPSVVRPTANKLLSGGPQGASCFAWITASTGIVTYKCTSGVASGSECNVFGIYSINF